VFFGFEADTAMAGYLFSVIDRAMATALIEFRVRHPELCGVGLRWSSTSFQQGMAARVARRLDQMHHERDAHIVAQRSTGTDLILIKKQVVEGAFRDAKIRLVSIAGLTREGRVPARTGCRRSHQPQPSGWRRRESFAAMIGARDCQRGKVYAWEERFVAPYDPSIIAFAQAQGMVNAIWTELGLRFPPKVEPQPRQARSTLADANRLTIRLPDSCPSWWLLHELAHSLTSSHDGRSDGHGAQFMGLYVQLVTRYLRLPIDALLTSAHAAGIDIELQAVPVFLDVPEPTRTSR
jgi:hypothetical protein